jgi:hypothetical protein
MSKALVDSFLSFSGTKNDLERVFSAYKLYGMSLTLLGVFPVPKLIADWFLPCSFTEVTIFSLKIALRISLATIFCS